MARVPLIEYDEADPETRAIFDEVVIPRYQRFDAIENPDGAPTSNESPHVIQPWRAWANTPQLMRHMAVLANYMVEECPWSIQNVELRTLMTNAIYRRYRTAEYGLFAHGRAAEDMFSPEQLALLDDLATARTSPLFDADERLVLSFCESVLETGDCKIEDWRQIVKRWGYSGAIELTACFGFWWMWVPAFAVFRTEPDHPDGS